MVIWANHLMNFLRSIGWKIIQQVIRKRFPTVEQLAPKALEIWLAQPTAPLLLDVRTAEEYEVSHLPKAQHAPHDFRCLEQWDITLETPIVVYCSVGYRSARYAQKLQAAGYKTVLNLQGSIFQWVNEGYLVQRNEQRVKQVHPYNGLWGALLNPAYRASLK
jgi:rhodanese-related sulfurtransferase